MRSLLLLIMGAVAGAVATVMLLSLDSSPAGPAEDGTGGGNARMGLDADAIEKLVQADLRKLGTFSADISVRVEVRPNGLIDVVVTAGVAPVGPVLDVVLDPEVADWSLAVVLVEARAGEGPAVEQLRASIESQLRQQLTDLASGFDYRLTAITTTGNRLMLEIEI